MLRFIAFIDEEIDCVRSCDQKPYLLNETKWGICIKIEFNKFLRGCSDQRDQLFCLFELKKLPWPYGWSLGWKRVFLMGINSMSLAVCLEEDRKARSGNCPVKLTGPVVTGTFEKRVPGPKRLFSEETMGSSGWEVSEIRKFAIKGGHKGQITLTRDKGRKVSFVSISLRWKFEPLAVEITRNIQVQWSLLVVFIILTASIWTSHKRW